MKSAIHHILVSALLLVTVAVSSAQTSQSQLPSKTSVGSPQSEGQQFNIEQWWQRRQPSDRAPIAVSADGKWLAITLHGILREGRMSGAALARAGGVFEVCGEALAGSEVLLVERATGKITRPFAKFAASFLPVWQPDEPRLLVALQEAVTRFPQLAVWSPGEETPRVFADATIVPMVGFATPCWLPDGRQVVFKHRATEKPIGQRITHTTADGKGGLVQSAKMHYMESLAVLDTSNGKVRQYPAAAATSFSSWGFRVSPDGKKVAYAGHADGGSKAVMANWSRLTVLHLESGAIQSFGEIQPEGWGLGLSWSPNGRHIGWRPVSHGAGERLIVAEVDASTLHTIVLPKDASAGNLHSVGAGPPAPPLWDADGSGFWVAGKHALLHFDLSGKALGDIKLSTEEGSGGIDWLENMAPSSVPATAHRIPVSGELLILHHRQIERVSLTSRTAETVARGKLSSHDWFERAHDISSASLFTLRTTGGDGCELIQTSLKDGKTSRLALLYEGLGKIQYGITKSLSWKLADGTACGGTLLLPMDWKPGNLPPVIMDLYGNDRGKGDVSLTALHEASYIVDPHLLGRYGYAFFKPDMPQTDAEPASSLARSAEAAADALRDSGLVDAERICIMGQSYGGYTVMSVLARSKRFRCGIAACGIYDLPRMTLGGMSGYVEGGQGRMQASLWDKPQRYLENSPIYALDKLSTPLLVLQGDADNLTKDQGLALFVALTRLGKPFEYINGVGMAHAPTYWTIEAQRELIPKVLAFLEKNLKPQP